MGRQTARSDAKRGPTFFWQGALLVLPVALLAAVGLISLRQDKSLARVAAVDQAQNLADLLAPQIWSRLTAGVSNADHFFQADAAGALVFPPPCQPAPEPRVYDLAELSTEQARLWLAAHQSETGPRGTSTPLQFYRDFVATRPPRDFLAAAHYAAGLMLANGGKPEQAVEEFKLLINQFPNATGESGLPLSALAELKVAVLETQMLSNHPPVDFDVICSNWVSHPSAITPELLQQLALASPQAREVTDKWQRIWRQQEESRALSAASRNLQSQTAFWFKPAEPVESEVGDESWFAIRADPQGTNATFVCRTESEVGGLVLNLVAQTRGLPEYFGISTELTGRRLVRFAPDLRLWTRIRNMTKGGSYETKDYSSQVATDVLATATAQEAPPNQLRVSVLLTSPETLFKLQATRRFWFGSLIAAAAVAAAVGLVSAYRAFNRQLRLSELKSNFVSSVSHELRAPLASARLLAESLERGKISEPSKQQEYFRFIVQECRRLSSLIENVLDFSRIEQGRKQYEFEPTDLVGLTRQTVKLMETYAAEKQVTLALALPSPHPAAPPPSPPASARSRRSEAETDDPQPNLDGKAIQQALVNLIDNAIKHSPKEGIVTVGLEWQEAAQRQPSRTLPEATGDEPPRARVLLWVEDHGDGIPASEQEKIFERFYRRGPELRRQTQGVGIGLSIVKHIVEAHGGRVLVTSEVGKGSRFTIIL